MPVAISYSVFLLRRMMVVSTIQQTPSYSFNSWPLSRLLSKVCRKCIRKTDHEDTTKVDSVFRHARSYWISKIYDFLSGNRLILPSKVMPCRRDSFYGLQVSLIRADLTALVRADCLIRLSVSYAGTLLLLPGTSTNHAISMLVHPSGSDRVRRNTSARTPCGKAISLCL